jgi:nucleotide-binding universal stress UspA family protein
MRILLATDGSPSADVAVELVAGIDWPAGTAIRVVESVEVGRLFGGPWPAVELLEAGRLEAEAREVARATVDAARVRLERPGLEVTTTVLADRPATGIVEVAHEMDAELIVVGSRGHGTIESMVLGSVSSEVVDHAPAPVLVARRSAVRRVALAWDGSDCSRLAVDLVRTFPMLRGAEVRVISVADVQIPWWTGFPAIATPEVVPMYVEASEASRRHHAELARAMAAELGAAGISATAASPEGDAATEIIAAAAAWDADLIVLGTHGRTGFRRFVLGSVARNVLHHAHASVLVVREVAPRKDDREER